MSKTADLPEIYKTTTLPVVGNKYHLSWAKPGCVWRLLSFNVGTGNCDLVTIKSRKRISAKISDLRLLKENAYGYKPN